MNKQRLQTEHPLIESVTSNVMMIDPDRIGVVSASLFHLTADPKTSAMLNQADSALGGDDFWCEDMSYWRPYVVTDGILQIPIQGVLLNRMSYQLGRWATGYTYIEKALNRGLADANVRGIALIVDSPGGEVAGCFELSDKIYAGRAVKPIRAFAADYAASAAYALASSADDITVTRSGKTGSVGVVTMHVDYSEMMAKDGIKVTFVFAGEHKVDGNPFEKLPDAVKARIQERIDKTYAVFTGTVARNRGLEEQAVRDTKALTYDAQDSLANGFADKIGAVEEEMVIFALADTEQEDETMTTFTQDQLDQAVAAARADGVKAGETQGIASERARVQGIMDLAEAKDRPIAARAAAEAGLSKEAAQAMLAKLPTEKAETKTEEPKAPQNPLATAMDQTGGGAGIGASGGDQAPADFATGFFASFGRVPQPQTRQ